MSYTGHFIFTYVSKKNMNSLSFFIDNDYQTKVVHVDVN
ncbi:hypothetical protein GW12_25090 [Acinetobacter sp. HR7]|nr:hypothetical protein GW12_25090 [Acinetobacter sp. HR7]